MTRPTIQSGKSGEIRLSIRQKIMIGFGVIIALMIITNAVVLVELNSISDSTKATLSTHVSEIDIAKGLQTILVDQERNTGKFLVSRDRAYYDLFTEDIRKFDSAIDSLLLLGPDPDEANLIHQIRRRHAWFISAVATAANQNVSEGNGVNDRFRFALKDSLTVIINKLEDIVRQNQSEIRTAMASVEETTANSLSATFVLTIATLVLASILIFVIARTITSPIDKLIRGTDRISKGIFEPIPLTSKDEIALLTDAVNEMSRKLKEISEYKSNMMHQISHELRSPLSTILGAHFLIADGRSGPVNEEQKRMLDIIREGVDKITAFSHQFLDLATVESGMMKYSFERTSVLPLVERVVREGEIAARQKNITVQLHAAPVPEVMIDVEKMSMIFSNLMSNAIKYTLPDGSIRVEVEPLGEGVRITVTDSGIGIAEQDLPHVFTKFYKAGNAARSGSAGSGIGLALAKGFADGHGATLSVKSVINSGSSFILDIPPAGTNGHAEPLTVSSPQQSAP